MQPKATGSPQSRPRKPHQGPRGPQRPCGAFPRRWGWLKGCWTLPKDPGTGCQDLQGSGGGPHNLPKMFCHSAAALAKNSVTPYNISARVLPKIQIFCRGSAKISNFLSGFCQFFKFSAGVLPIFQIFCQGSAQNLEILPAFCRENAGRMPAETFFCRQNAGRNFFLPAFCRLSAGCLSAFCIEICRQKRLIFFSAWGLPPPAGQTTFSVTFLPDFSGFLPISQKFCPSFTFSVGFLAKIIIAVGAEIRN